jgi:hypothetical protein
MAPQRNHQRLRDSRGGFALSFVGASISFWNCTLTRLKK